MSKLKDKKSFEQAFKLYWAGEGERPEYEKYNIGCYESAVIRERIIRESGLFQATLPKLGLKKF